MKPSAFVVPDMKHAIDLQRSQDARNKQAAIDSARILSVALDVFEQMARDCSIGFSTGHLAFIAGSADIRPDRFASYDARDTYIARLLAELRATLNAAR